MHAFHPIKYASMTAVAIALFAIAPLAAQAQMMPMHSSTPAANAPQHTLRLGLEGYSPVSYLQHNRAEPGSPRYHAEHHGVTYFFTSHAQQQAFQANPEKYLPAYGGYCAYGCALNAKFIPDPTNFKVVDGRTLLFLKNKDIDTLKLWDDANESQQIHQADQYWLTQTQSRAYVGARNVPASGLGIEGFSPVSYFTQSKAEKGDPQFSVEHNGVTYHLASAKQVEMFQANPAKYEPKFGGWCAFGMAIQDKFPIDPTQFKIVDGQLYLFLNNAQINARDLWESKDQTQLIQEANSHWRKVSQ